MSLQEAFIARTGMRPVEGYGLTEAVAGGGRQPPLRRGPARDHRPALPRHGPAGHRSRDGRATMPFDGDWTLPGEIVVRGPQVMKGYWNRPDETAGQMIDGWLRTGDSARCTATATSRWSTGLKDLIIRGGMKIYPAEVESVLARAPQGAAGAGHRCPRPGAGRAGPGLRRPASRGRRRRGRDPRATAAENLAKYKVPSAVEFRPELPKSAVGKPLRRLLREECLAGAAGREG